MTDGEILLQVAFMIFVGIVGIAVLIMAHRRSPMRILLQKTTPEPRERLRRKPFGCVAFAKWQADAARFEETKHIQPGCGPHLLSCDGRYAVLRSGAENYMRRVLLLPFVMLPLFAVSLLILIKATAWFFRSGIHRDFPSDFTMWGVTILPATKYDSTLGAFLTSRIHLFGNYLSDGSLANFGGVGGLFEAFFMSDSFFLLLLIITATISLYVLLSRTDPPLVFDRKRQRILTVYRGHLYAARWRHVKMTMGSCGRQTSLIFALKDIEGERGERWFTLASWGSRWLVRNPGPSPLMDIFQGLRWMSMHQWLVLFMEDRDLPVGKMHTPWPEKLFALREGRLPEKLEDRVRDAVLGPKGGHLNPR